MTPKPSHRSAGGPERGPIRIGTRGSALALAQARLVAAAIERAGHPTELVTIITAGDRRAPDTAWGEGAFVGALEQALLGERVDVAVHSAKDVPTDEDDRLVLAAFLPREDPRDALVVRADGTPRTLADLPSGARVGTDSPRRTGFLRSRRPDLLVHPLHGNVDTRLRRLDDGETDALILAVAGLVRLGRGERIAEALHPADLPPAPGQGAIAVQVRAGDDALRAALSAVDDPATRCAVEAERAFLRAAGGGCRAPIGSLATVDDERLSLLGGFARPDGSRAATRTITGSTADAAQLAAELVQRLASAVPGVRGTGTIAAAGPDLPVPGAPRILVTRQAEQAAPLVLALSAQGFEPCLVPTIATRDVPPGGPLDEAAAETTAGGWIVVTSPNGAQAMAAALGRAGILPATRRWAVVGDATAAVLVRHGVESPWRPTRATGAGLAMELPIEPGEQVLVARTNIASPDVPDLLRARGAMVRDVIAYETVEGPSGSRRTLETAFARMPPSVVVFASGSAARGLLALARPDLTAPCLAIPAVCIGESTAAVVRELGFHVVGIAASPSINEVVRLVREATDSEPRNAVGVHHQQPIAASRHTP